jgi:hypothetical protein
MEIQLVNYSGFFRCEMYSPYTQRVLFKLKTTKKLIVSFVFKLKITKKLK